MDAEVTTSHQIAIIGAGSVGGAVAYALLLHPVAGTLLLADQDAKMRRAQVQDLSDAAFFGGVEVKEATNKEAGRADVIVITAGAKQRPGETRLDLVDRNLMILRSIISDMQPLKSDAVLLIVANPVDVLTHFAQAISGLPKNQVIGTGTFLDSVRLRGNLAKKIAVGLRSGMGCFGSDVF
jgi:L-lactate dehydrogenase